MNQGMAVGKRQRKSIVVVSGGGSRAGDKEAPGAFNDNELE